MGSNAIFAVLALLVAFGFISGAMNERDKRAAENTYGYMKYTVAREIARNSVNIALKKVSDSSGTKTVSGSLSGGVYNVTLTRSGDTMNIRAVATFSDSSYTILTKLNVQPVPFPGVGAAANLNVDSVGVVFKGTPDVDGRDYDVTGTTVVDTGVPGVAVLTHADSARVAAADTCGCITNGIVVSPGMPNPWAYLDVYKGEAKYTFTTSSQPPPLDSGMYGMLSSPQITYIVGSKDPQHPLKLTGNMQGWGVMVVEGYVQFNGTVDWHGLVAVASSANIDFSLAKGTPMIVGSLIMAGPPGSTLEMRGTADIRYSSAALNLAKWIGELLAYHMVDWYE